ncbi:MAG: glycoside hydrolase family 3 C-terminal domain-containing protein [Streptosporangiaceae bacterium]
MKRTFRAVALAPIVALTGALAVAGPSPSAAAPGGDRDRPWLDASQPIGKRVEELLSRMTLGEKVHEMYGVRRPRGVHSVGYVPGVKRLGIPPLVLSDGPVGVKDSCWQGPPGNCELRESTALPAAVSLAASFDPRLARRYGGVIGAEARARGVDVVYGPAMDIVRVPQGGRNFEYFSEDPYLTGRTAAAWVKGIQSQDVAAQVKHYALNNQERDRHTSTSNADERTIREMYLPAWHDAVTDGHAFSLMCANNKVDGTYNCENTHLLRETLKGEWGWRGVVGSDYAATHSALGSVNGGLDQAFTGRDWGKWYSGLPALVRAGKVSEALIDQHVRRILRMMFRLGMFDGDRTGGGPVDAGAHGAFARGVAAKGTVLLENDRGVLPLDAKEIGSVAVIGPREYAGQAMTGGGGSSHVKPYYTVSPVRGIRDRVGDGTRVTYAQAAPGPGADIDRAVAASKAADVAVVIVGYQESEGQDRQDIDLPDEQNALVDAVVKANPETVVVLNTGSAVAMPWISDVHALLEMWYPGEEDGNALAAILFGDVNPSGKLPVTFPVGLGQDCCHSPPRYPAASGVYAYSEGLLVGYRWYDARHLRSLFPFGYGLSYTTFDFSDLTVTPKTINPGHDVSVSFRVTNTGSRTGTATPQVYLGFPSGVGEPPHRLVAARKVRLRPGQTRRVTMTVPRRGYSYWSSAAHNWDVAPGAYTVSVGPSSRDLPLRGSFRVHHADGVHGITVESPDTIADGASAEATVTISNSGSHPLTHPSFRLRVPAGWTATATSRAPARVPAGGQASLTYRISAPGGAEPAPYLITAAAHWRGLASGSATRAVTIRATPPTR